MSSLHSKELMLINQSSLSSNTSNLQTPLRLSNSPSTPGHLISITIHGVDLKTQEIIFSDQKRVNLPQMFTADMTMASNQLINSWISTLKRRTTLQNKLK
jgi:hypothetical protein